MKFAEILWNCVKMLEILSIFFLNYVIFYEICEIGFRDGPGEPAQALRQNVRAVRLKLRGPAVGFARLALT